MPGPSEPIWLPSADYVQRAELTALFRQLGTDEYRTLYRHSIARPDDYWQTVMRHLDIHWSRPYGTYVDLSAGLPFPRWFVDGRLNWVSTFLARAGARHLSNQPAVVSEREDGSTSTTTYAELALAVQKFASGLRDLGFARADRIGLLMPMGLEAVVSFLAISYIGAIAVPLFTGFGTDAVVARLSIAGARGLIAPAGFTRRGRRIDLGPLLREVVMRLPQLDLVLDDDGGASELPAHASWDAIAAHDPDRPIEILDPNDPFMIVFTSGTTGAPKGTVHTHGGFPLKIAHDAIVHFDLRERDVWLWPADMGWVVGPITTIGALMRGATLVCYDGAPDVSGWNRHFRLVDKHRVTHYGASPTLIRALASNIESRAREVTSLRILITAGEVIDPEHFIWFSQAFGAGRCPVINYTGGTEVSGALLANVVVEPIFPSGFNAVSPAIELDVLGEDARPLTDQVGELVIRKPFVGMTLPFWQDRERYLETYWSRWPDLWVHGDLALRRQDGVFFLLGRSDDTLKIAGKRLGPAEVEAIVLEHPDVAEAAAIGIADAAKGQKLVLFVVAADPAAPQLETELGARIEERLGKPFRPDRVHVVAQLPKTRNAKVMRRVVRRVYLGEPPGDISALENPAALDAIRAAMPAASGNARKA